jgi:hypothetical protein
MRPERSNNFDNRPNEVRRARIQSAAAGRSGAAPVCGSHAGFDAVRRGPRAAAAGVQNLAPEQQAGFAAIQSVGSFDSEQRADLRAKEDTWRRMRPEQRDHIKNDVLPKWRQMPWERQQVIQQKLGVLQNMPEAARNRRLSDPNFTRGMSDEDRQTLHDLSHLHVGGAPDPPGNEQ